MKFDELYRQGLISKPSLDACLHSGYTTLTDIQAQSIHALLAGKDMLARAKTGTGKTLAFLLPTIEHLIRSPSSPSPPSQRGISTKDGIKVLVVTPTRELAQQIEQEALRLLHFHEKAGLAVQCVVGGTNVKSDLHRLRTHPPAILIGTPGRLLDLIQNHRLLLTTVRFYVLDECDRLLDEGFRRDMDRLCLCLPAVSERQTLLFSATVSQEIREISKTVLKKDHVSVSTVGEEDDGTHAHVDQFLCPVESLNDQLPRLLELILQELSRKRQLSKMVVFLPTARMTQLAYELFSNVRLHLPLFELHSRKSQSQRTRTSDQFRDAPQGILFSSDVSARGLDFPGITLVSQVGLPANKEQYIHRLGRTARAGSDGRGILLLSKPELFFVKSLDGIDLKTWPSSTPIFPDTFQKISHALSRVSPQTKNQTYAAQLGFYKSFLKSLHWSPAQLVEQMNAFALQALECTHVPGVLKKTVGKMGLKGVPGLNLVNELGGVSRVGSVSAVGDNGGARAPRGRGGRACARGGRGGPDGRGGMRETSDVGPMREVQGGSSARGRGQHARGRGRGRGMGGSRGRGTSN